MTAKIPTFGYKAGEAKLFELELGEALPDGWFDSPAKCQAQEISDAPAPQRKKKHTPIKAEDGNSDGN